MRHGIICGAYLPRGLTDNDQLLGGPLLTRPTMGLGMTDYVEMFSKPQRHCVDDEHVVFVDQVCSMIDGWSNFCDILISFEIPWVSI